jgi:hypothetical protein
VVVDQGDFLFLGDPADRVGELLGLLQPATTRRKRRQEHDRLRTWPRTGWRT